MTAIPESAKNAHEPLATARQLGESFAAVIGGGDWQIDEIPDAIPIVDPVKENGVHPIAARAHSQFGQGDLVGALPQ